VCFCVYLFQNQAAETQLQIQAQFEQLHQALQHEESDRLAALKREEEEKLVGMKEKISEVSEEMRSLQESFSALESELDADDMTVLQVCSRYLLYCIHSGHSFICLQKLTTCVCLFVCLFVCWFSRTLKPFRIGMSLTFLYFLTEKRKLYS